MALAIPPEPPVACPSCQNGAELDERIKDMPKEFDDIKLKLDAIHDLPDGARPIQFIKDFGDTAALMLTGRQPAG